LDSLDAVEVVMAIEEEFAVEIPDEEADQITSVAQGTFKQQLSLTCRGLLRDDIMDDRGGGVFRVFRKVPFAGRGVAKFIL
jgi:hypothetical protein